MIFGYARVSTQDQNLGLQMDALTARSCDEIVSEKVSSRLAHRPAWDGLLAKLRAGDTVVVYKLDRIARSTRELLKIMDDLAERNVHFCSFQEPWIDTASPAGKMIFTVMSGIAEFERDLIRDRTQAGRIAAQKRGVQFGRPAKISPDQYVLIEGALAGGTPVQTIARSFNVSADTVYRLKKRLQNQ